MEDLWLTTDGGLVLDATGAVLLCSACPCHIDFDCEAAVREAIRERQIPAGRTQWTLVDQNFATCKTETGLIAQVFIQGAYAEGAQSGPQFWSTAYGSNATTWCELYEMLRVLRTTGLVSGWAQNIAGRPLGYWTRLTPHNYYSIYPPNNNPQQWGTPWTTIIDLARARWINGSGSINPPSVDTNLYSDQFGRHAVTSANGAIVRMVSPWCAISRTARFFIEGKATTGRVYDNFGLHAMAEHQYALIWTSPTGVWNNWFDAQNKLWSIYATSEWPAYPLAFPEHWPVDDVVPDRHYEGATVVYLLDWDFVHV